MNLLTTEKRIAVLENSKAAEFYFSHPASEDLTGNIYLGKVTKVLPGMQAAFVDIGINKNGFLHRDQLISYQTSELELEKKKEKNIREFVHEGELLLVQVEKNSVGTKGPKLTNLIELSGESLVYVPNGNYVAVSKKMQNEETRTLWRETVRSLLTGFEGVVIRTSAENSSATTIHEEINRLRNEYMSIMKKSKSAKAPSLLYTTESVAEKILASIGMDTVEEVIVDTSHAFQIMKSKFPSVKASYYNGKENIFSHYSIEQEIERLSKKIVWLQNGSYLVIEHTEAMTIIDVNTGKFTGKSNLKDTVLKANEQAAIEIARQIRLRDIGGMILIDFIDMKSDEDRSRIERVLKEQLRGDRTRTVVYGFTKLGILEMTRKRVRENILFQTSEICQTCGNGHVSSREVVLYKLERELMEFRGVDAEAIWVEATKHLLDLLKNTSLIETIENTLQVKLFFTELLDAKPNYYIRHIGSKIEIEERMNTG